MKVLKVTGFSLEVYHHWLQVIFASHAKLNGLKALFKKNHKLKINLRM